MNRIEIPLPNGYRLTAEQNEDSQYPYEMFIGIADKNGCWWQDLAIVRNAYGYDDKDELVWKDGEFDVLVFGREDDTDYTESFEIGLYREDE